MPVDTVSLLDCLQTLPSERQDGSVRRFEVLAVPGPT